MSLGAADLYVFTARFNPLRWKQPHDHFLAWVDYMLDQCGVNVVVIECQIGERAFECNVRPEHPRFIFYGVRSSTPAWSKENLLNIAISRTPQAKYICWSDSDIFFEKTTWGGECVHALQMYDWIQPWTQCIDRGPNGEILNDRGLFVSFCWRYEEDGPDSLIPDRHGWRAYHHRYPHPGYCWASRRDILDITSGLFELAAMGAGDHSMALALVGKADRAAPPNVNPNYVGHLLRWQQKVQHAVNGNIGFAHNVINHKFHGAKRGRNYLPRWGQFIRHGFNPDTDLKKNSWQVIDWVGNKPELEREWRRYLRLRQEDANIAGEASL